MFRCDWIAADPAREGLPAAFDAADFPVGGLSNPGRAVVRQEARIKAIVTQRRRTLERFRFMSLLVQATIIQRAPCARGYSCGDGQGRVKAPEREHKAALPLDLRKGFDIVK
jgi:hypothetical protein